MKIIAQTSTGYLVDATMDEIAQCAGFSSTYDDGWKDVLRKSGWPGYDKQFLRIGTEIKVSAAHDFHSRIAQHQDKARSSAGLLRGLADMLDGVMPDVVIPPAAPADKSSDAAEKGE